ncbi:hypothetical protein TSAR_012802, partial [Trichomalopsis sarcophagae]
HLTSPPALTEIWVTASTAGRRAEISVSAIRKKLIGSRLHDCPLPTTLMRFELHDQHGDRCTRHVGPAKEIQLQECTSTSSHRQPRKSPTTRRRGRKHAKLDYTLHSMVRVQLKVERGREVTNKEEDREEMKARNRKAERRLRARERDDASSSRIYSGLM